MAGSYNHCVDNRGRLLVNEQLQGMLECCSGDVYEAVQEMYGMIWVLADQIAVQNDAKAADVVETARRNYEFGLQYSPGINGSHPQEAS